MFSYQQEYPETIEKVVEAIKNWQNSKEREAIMVCKSYYNGENDFILKYKKQVWSDSQQKIIDNIFAPNHKVQYNFFGDMVSQKINSLMGETPTIPDVDETVAKDIGYTLKNAGEEASVVGYSLIYEGFDSFKTFETENCMVYLDDITDEIKRVIRFWVKKVKEQEQLYFEVYEETGFTTYKVSKDKIDVVKELQGYKQKITASRISTENNIVKLSRIPIVIFMNNKEMKTDLKPNIKSKIDMIDFVESGLIDNIDEFSDVWITVNVPSATQEQVAQIKETIRRTKATIFAGSDDKNSVGFETLQIPYEARAKAVEMLKSELVEDAGVIDFRDIKGQATNVQIQARLLKLQQRVSDFEWYADKVGIELIKIWQEYHDVKFEPSITFQKLYIKNNQEIVQMAISLYSFVSQETFYGLLKDAGVIDNVEDEIDKVSAEGINKFRLDEVLSGYSTQANRQDIVD